MPETPASTCSGSKGAETAACPAAACFPVALPWFTGPAGRGGTRACSHAQDGPQSHLPAARPEGMDQQQRRRTLWRTWQHLLLRSWASSAPQHDLTAPVVSRAFTPSSCFRETLPPPHPQAGRRGAGNASIRAARHAAIFEILCCKSFAITVRLHSSRAARFLACLAYYRQFLLTKSSQSLFCWAGESASGEGLCTGWQNGSSSKSGRLNVFRRVIIGRGGQYLRA